MTVAGAAAYTALRPHEGWAKKAAQEPPRLQPWSLPMDAPARPDDLARALIGAAVLAPSHWNTQPWRFEVTETGIHLTEDWRRALPVSDPDQRYLKMALGASLENMLIAARAYGLRPRVAYAPHVGVVAEVSWSDGDTRRDRDLFTSITRRRTNRHDYDGKGIFPQNRAQLLAQVPDEYELYWVDDVDTIRNLAEVARDAAEIRVRDEKAQAEQYGWIRYDNGDARKKGDGVTTEALALAGASRWMAKRFYNPKSWFLRFGIENSGRQTRSQIRSSGALALLATRGGESSWVGAGQVFQRIALKATHLGIAHQPLNAPLEVEGARRELERRFGVRGSQPLMLIRLGHAGSCDPSVRRNVALVSSFRTT
jgi:hypothetical protein